MINQSIKQFQTDFLMVVLRDMVNTYKEMKLILMSATIDTSLFVEYFGECYIVEVHGRQHPVQGRGVEVEVRGVVRVVVSVTHINKLLVFTS